MCPAAITQPPLGMAAMATNKIDQVKEQEIKDVCYISALCGYEPNLFDRQSLGLLPLTSLVAIKNGLRRPCSQNDLTAQQIFDHLLATALNALNTASVA